MLLRGIAMESISQDTATEIFAPLPSPTGQAGATLEAWAGRFVSWTGDQTGTLTEEQLAEVKMVATKAAETASSSSDLPTILKILRGLILVRLNRGPATGTLPGDAEFLEALNRAELAVQTRFSRLLSVLPEISSTDGLAEVARLGKEISDLLTPAGGSSGSQPPEESLSPPSGSPFKREESPPQLAVTQQEFIAALGLLTAKFPAGIYIRDFSSDTSTELLEVLRNMWIIVQFLQAQKLAGTLNDLPPNFAALKPAYDDIKERFPGAQNEEFSAADAGDLGTIRKLLAGRAEFLSLSWDLGLPLPSDFGDTVDFGDQTYYLPQTKNLIVTWRDEMRKLPPIANAGSCRNDIRILNGDNVDHVRQWREHRRRGSV